MSKQSDLKFVFFSLRMK